MGTTEYVRLHIVFREVIGETDSNSGDKEIE